MRDKIIDLFLEKEGFIHKNLELKKNDKKGYFFISNSKIKKNSLLINVPKKLLIQVDKIKNFKDFDNEFEKEYFNLLLNNSEYLKFHPLNSKLSEFNEIIDILKKNENLVGNFKKLYQNFNLLNKEEKLIKLFTLTRSIFLKKYKKNFFMPIMDFVNHDENGTNYMVSDNSSVYILSNKVLKKNDEVLVNYTHTDSISFYLKQGFINDDFNSFQIKKNELNFKINKDMKVNERFFLKVNDMIKFKENIDFKKNQFSKNVIDFMKIFPADKRLINMLKILNYYKNTVKYDEKMLYNNKNSIIIKNFRKSVELYSKIIDNYSKIISNQYEKN